MTTKAESIAAAVVTALGTPTMTSVPTARVFRDLNDALASDKWPAIVVDTGDEGAPVRAVIGHKMRDIEVRVMALGTSYAGIDAVVIESFGRLMADPTLGGKAFEFDELETTRTREGAAQNVVAVTKGYSYKFRTTEGSLES